MICGKCRAEVPGENSYEYAGVALCEDCYVDAVSAPKTCDPWAVYSATRTMAKDESLTADQRRIVDLLGCKGPLSVEQICAELGLGEGDFRSNFSTLRHMELAQACKKDGRVVYLPFVKPVSGSNRPPKREVA